MPDKEESPMLPLDALLHFQRVEMRLREALGAYEEIRCFTFSPFEGLRLIRAKAQDVMNECNELLIEQRRLEDIRRRQKEEATR